MDGNVMTQQDKVRVHCCEAPLGSCGTPSKAAKQGRHGSCGTADVPSYGLRPSLSLSHAHTRTHTAAAL